MSQTGEEYTSYKEQWSLRNKERRAINNVAVVAWCERNSVKFAFINDWQIRIANQDKSIDIFTQSKRYHNITDNVRGKIAGKITDFLTTNFI
jgi:hypothetical protein